LGPRPPVDILLANDALLCIDKGLEAFGENVKELIYEELVFRQCVSLDEILTNSQPFLAVLNRAFGEAGLSMVERAVVGVLKSRFFDLKQMGGSYSIPDAFEILRNGESKGSDDEDACYSATSVLEHPSSRSRDPAPAR